MVSDQALSFPYTPRRTVPAEAVPSIAGLLKNSLFEAINPDREINGRNSSEPVLSIKNMATASKNASNSRIRQRPGRNSYQFC